MTAPILWTAQQDAILLDEYKRGTKLLRISLMLKRSETAILDRLRKLSVERRVIPWSAEDDRRLIAAHATGATVQEIATAINRAYPAVVRHMRRLRLERVTARRRPWSTNDDAKLRAAFERGENIGMLAQRLNRSSGAIHERLRHIGIRRAPTPERLDDEPDAVGVEERMRRQTQAWIAHAQHVMRENKLKASRK